MATTKVVASNDHYQLTPFGQQCTEGRTAMTMTRPEMAKLVNTSPRDISLMESGQKIPPAHYVVLAMGVLGLDLEEVEAALAAQDPTYRLTRVSQPRYGDVR
ncbi:helix-turn-helix domain-containing protein [Mesorhizobium sp. M0016]|uniref:helix-turn-helix domain-containing protein n=1 Tax=Mesorhizobium sp. M0016 TaxID=2956843 RepID=UPI0033390F6E